MSQKVNPIAVRLRLNRLSDSSWYSDYYYSKLLYQDINFREYLKLIKQPNANKLGLRTGKCIIHFYPKKTLIHLFCVGRSRVTKPHALRALEKPKEYPPVEKLQMSKTERPSRTEFLLNSTLGSSLVPKFITERFATQGATRQSHIEDDIHRNRKAIVSYIRQASNFSRFAFILMVMMHIQFTYAPNHYQNIIDLQNRSDSQNHEAHTLFLNNLLKIYEAKGCEAQLLLKCLKKPNLFYKLWVELFEDHFAPAKLPQFRFLSKSTQILRKTNQTSKLMLSRYLLLMASGLTFSVLNAQKGHKTQTGLKALSSEALNADLIFNYKVMQYFLLKNTNTPQAPCYAAYVLPYGRPSFDVLPKSRAYYFSNLESVFSEKTKTATHLRIIKVSSIFQSASLIAQEIACKLEQKKSFRQICRSIFQQIAVCKYIKGIRISCSGRLNGAEIAKTECRKYGETSLHVFSDKIDYAQTKASTQYGILGVKVWISYV